MLPRISQILPPVACRCHRRIVRSHHLSQAQTKGGQLIYSTVAGPASLDPYMAGSLIELEVIHEIFESLVAMDENYNAKPDAGLQGRHQQRGQDLHLHACARA